jgi:hypothetical protein
MNRTIKKIILFLIVLFTFFGLCFAGFYFFIKEKKVSFWNKAELDSYKQLCLDCTESQSETRQFLLITDLGLDQETTLKAIYDLPAEVVLSFSGYAPQSNKWIHEAKSCGHKVLLQVANEEEAMKSSLVPYFDGILLLPSRESLKKREEAEDLIEYLKKITTFVVDMRSLPDNMLLNVADMLNFPIIRVDYSLFPDEIIRNKAKLSDFKGVIAVNAMLLSYVIDQIKEQKCVFADLKDINTVKE